MQFPIVVFIKNISELTDKVWTANWGTLTQWWNDHDSGTRSWTKVVSNSFSGPLTGTTTNDSAPAGNVGEYKESVLSAGTSVGTSGQYFDLTSLALTPGDWDVTLITVYYSNGSVITSPNLEIGIGTVAGNDPTGFVAGSSSSYYIVNAISTSDYITLTVPNYRISLSGNKPYYAKGYISSYSGATPKYYCRFSARRVR